MTSPMLDADYAFHAAVWARRLHEPEGFWQRALTAGIDGRMLEGLIYKGVSARPLLHQADKDEFRRALVRRFP